MKQFIDKLIERLEEEKSLVPYNRLLDTIGDKPKEVGQLMTYQRVIAIVNQLAEEHKDDIQTIDVSELLGESVNDGWIPCSERLPELGQKCICTVNKAKFTDAKNDVVASIYKDIYVDKWKDWYLAWQPLPAPYQPKGE